MSGEISQGLKYAGFSLFALGLILPVVMYAGGGMYIYELLAGNDPTPNQNAMVVGGLATLTSIVLGTFSALTGAVLFAIGLAADP
ncbi:MAG TPA: hypothetical protein VGB55_10675 [Tepidisphaeraceae bacterium]|jgi:hypothetical protein